VHRLGRRDGDRALLELLELLPGEEEGLEIGIGGADRLRFLIGTADSALDLDAGRVDAQATDFGGRHAVAGVGDLLDGGNVGLHGGDLAFHARDILERGRCGGGGDLCGGED
jgi:hypothetical protein